jgi:hypothetical protein
MKFFIYNTNLIVELFTQTTNNYFDETIIHLCRENDRYDIVRSCKNDDSGEITEY